MRRFRPKSGRTVPYAVIDTNILVSALLRPAGPPGQVMAAALAGRLIPVVSDAVLAEYASVLTRPRLRLDAQRVRQTLDALRSVGVPVHAPMTPPPDLPDPDDWPFIACALAAGCPVVTGNAKDFPPRLGVTVVTAREWVDALASLEGY